MIIRECIPKVSVLMSVYNGEKYLRDAIDSILNQTFTNYEFIIIDDGSVDSTTEIIASYKDRRIKLIKNKNNLGLVESLNKGLKIVRGKYIARMDADDISHPERLKTQVKFLDEHEDYGLVGTMFSIMNEKREIIKIMPVILDDEDLRLDLMFRNSFAHGSIMMRKNVLLSNNLLYRNSAKYFEDYDLWVRLKKFTKIKNISDVCYSWMINPEGTCSNNATKINNGSLKISKQLKKVTSFSRLTIDQLLNYYSRGKKYIAVEKRINDDHNISRSLQNYQYFILRLAFFSLSRHVVFNFIGLLFVAFFLRPSNCFSLPAIFILRGIKKYCYSKFNSNKLT